MSAFKPFLFDIQEPTAPRPRQDVFIEETFASRLPQQVGEPRQKSAPRQKPAPRPIHWPKLDLEGNGGNNAASSLSHDAFHEAPVQNAIANPCQARYPDELTSPDEYVSGEVERAGLDYAPEPRVVAAPPPPQVDIQPMLEAAREAGYRQGFDEGRAAAVDEKALEAQNQITRLQAALSELPQTLSSFAETTKQAASQEATRLAFEMLKRVFPRIGERYGFEEIASCLHDSLPDLLGEPRLVIQVAESLLDQIKEETDKIVEAHGYEGKIILLSRPGLEGADIKIEWADGGIERDAAAIWEGLDSALAALWDSQPNQGLLEPAQQDSQEHQAAEASPKILPDGQDFSSTVSDPNTTSQKESA